MYVLILDATSVLWSDKRVFLFVQEFCSHCPVCQLKQAQTTRPPLQPIIETDFLNRIQVDLIDMRHNPDCEFNYIGHFMDHFSKFHILFPLRKKTAEEVSYMLEECVFGIFRISKDFPLRKWSRICEKSH